MAFSESFDIGNSTFMNLENQGVVNVDRAEDDGKIGLDIIQESPTQTKGGTGTANFSRTRSRFIQGNLSRNTTDNRSRTRFRRSKSDSTLANAAPSREPTNYSEFFRSDFTFSVEEKEQKAEVEESSVLRVSQIEAAFDEIDTEELQETSCSALDVPICSEDVLKLLETEEPNEEVWHDSLPLSAESEIVLSEKIITMSEEGVHLLDTSSFVCPARDSEAAQQLAEQLQFSRRYVKEELANEQFVPTPPPSRNVVNSSSCCKPPDLVKGSSPAPIKPSLDTLSSPKKSYPAQPSFSSSTTKPAISSDLESLKRISAWNLPLSVLREYEKKGVVKMFDWQIECLSNPKVLFQHCNLVYSAPTSAGKTLVSEILLLKTVLERGKKVLLILPFISVVREKMFYLQDLLTAAGYRVEGFFGGYTPPGGFDSIHVAICTIEKANSIVNKLLEQGKLDEIGTVVVDEVHLISDPGRGYILELLLAKILYMSRKYALQIQVITMSATLANVELLKHWLDAELFMTDFRPVALNEMIKVGNKIYDCRMQLLRDVTQPLERGQQPFPQLQNDSDHVAQLCIETLLEGCSVVVFCPSKDWCENLAMQLAGAIHALGKTGNDWGIRLRKQINRAAIDEMKRQLRDIPTGLDSVLEKTVTYACAFHHAGLTTEERDIVEASFKSGALKIIVATSTLSSGVNLPARRVLIRSPLFGGKQMSSLTYRQMIGRAGRTGKDTLGESILICTDSNARIGKELITADLKPIASCLEMDSSTHLKRALLEVISSGVASAKGDIDTFVNCTLLSAQKRLSVQEKDRSVDDKDDGHDQYISDALDFLIEYEFIRLQENEETHEQNYVATRLGMACLASSMPPTDGLILFSELQKSRRCFVLESELHAVYLVTPYSVCYQMQDLDWLLFLDMWEKLTPAMKMVGELVGVKESFLVRAMRGQTKLDYKLMQIHKRFYTALALQELVNETPINLVSVKYKCTRGMLQSLQQMASTFAGIVTAFCNSLQWSTLSLIVAQFKERLYFGIHRDLIDLMRLPDLSHKRARALFDADITSLVELANADACAVEKVLFNAASFDSAKQHDHENAYEAEQRNVARNFFITGKSGLTVAEAAKLLVQEARQFVQYEIGVGNINWTQAKSLNSGSQEQEEHQMSYEEDKHSSKKRKSEGENKNTEHSPPKMVALDENMRNNQLEKSSEKDNSSSKKRKSHEMENTKAEHSSLKRLELTENVKDLQIVKDDKRTENKKNLEAFNDEEKPGTSKESQRLLRLRKVEEIKRNKLKELNAAKEELNQLKYHSESKNRDAKMQNKNIIVDSKASADSARENLREKPLGLVQKSESSTDKNGKQNLQLNSKVTNSVEKNKFENKNLPTRIIADSSNNKENVKKEIMHEQAVNTNERFENSPKDEPFSKFSKLKELAKPLDSDQFPKPSRHSLRRSQENIKNNLKDQTPSDSSQNHTPKAQRQTSHVSSKPRRSPRNHLASSTRLDTEKQSTRETPITASSRETPITPSSNKIQNMDDLFMDDDESFELNTGIVDALSAADKLNEPQFKKPNSLAFNKSSDEIASSQQLHHDVNANSPSLEPQPHASRFLRSYRTQRATSPRTQRKQEEKPTSSSIELSDLSLENSLIKNPIQLNASHILSCSKVETSSLSFKSIEIVDICGNDPLFKSAFKELMSAKRFGFCLGLQHLEGKQKPLIGANLLINQVNAAEQADRLAPSVLFQVDDSTYLTGIAFGINENIVYFMNMQEEGSCKGLTAALKCKYLRMILRSEENTLLIYDSKEQLKMLNKAIADVGEIGVALEDPKVANWLLQPDKALSLQQMAQQFAPECSALVSLCGSGRGYNSFGLDVSSAILAKVRCSIESCVTGHILKGQIENLERIGTGQLYKFFNELEMPLQHSLCNMEVVGFPSSEPTLRKLFQQMVESMKKLEMKIYEMHGSRFNLGSSSAVARVLGLHRKANGRISTSKQILEKIDSPISQLIITYRKLSVTLSKNIQPLLKCIKNDRIHGQSITFTATGRISMTEPNLQNVAKDFEVEIGSEKFTISCRSGFFPADAKRCLIASDFCQLEMRILAHLSQDSSLLQVMNSKKDIFIAIAARWNKITEDRVSEQLRHGTKQICYGIVYGMGMRSLSEALKCSEQEAKMVSEQFHLAYPGIRGYAEKVIKFARSNGYIETITGRRRYLEHINSGEPLMKSQAERQAVNSTIQGSAADIAKSAILRMEKNIAKYRQKLGIEENAVRLVLHLHDELIFEVPEEKAKKIAKVLSVTMENCVKLSVPLKVKLKIGRSWGELKEIKL